MLNIRDCPIGFGAFEALVEDVHDLLAQNSFSILHGGLLLGLHRVEERRRRRLGNCAPKFGSIQAKAWSGAANVASTGSTTLSLKDL